jgi:hypothetical protein
MSGAIPLHPLHALIMYIGVTLPFFHIYVTFFSHLIKLHRYNLTSSTWSLLHVPSAYCPQTVFTFHMILKIHSGNLS